MGLIIISCGFFFFSFFSRILALKCLLSIFPMSSEMSCFWGTTSNYIKTPNFELRFSSPLFLIKSYNSICLMFSLQQPRGCLHGTVKGSVQIWGAVPAVVCKIKYKKNNFIKQKYEKLLVAALQTQLFFCSLFFGFDAPQRIPSPSVFVVVYLSYTSARLSLSSRALTAMKHILLFF